MPETIIDSLKSLWKAILGRNEPSQLAWGVAFGVLLGLVPLGNLLGVAFVVAVLTLRINHGVAALTAFITLLLATHVDPFSHQLGHFVLTHPSLLRQLAGVWQLPLVPWTDLNNTVVMGSTLIGLAALIPIFLFAYPMFHLFRSQGTPIDDGNSSPQPILGRSAARTAKATRVAVNRDHRTEPALPPMEPSAVDVAMSGMVKRSTVATQASEPQVVETRIDVIRLGQRNDAPRVEATDISQPDQPMSEALNYLLRQLQDSRQRRAA